ncbi:PRC-barrel domain-containing protein [Hyphococcus flavus]|uniref:PRC-barrel domain-containing protein n=1 Tax=Hyphococcus flavus TaxID=1866326 RepID=A0AAE9ZD72_9PROT|nr:PRC-barrel domain-containing protein [Hyphococcus flavus]WDI30802.1 PRC-barrel domain-containing protein [Hyphococcus flavus]
MKNMIALSTASLFALSVAACGQDNASPNEPKPGDIAEEAADDTTDTLEDAGEEISAAVNDAARDAADMAENELSQSNAKGFTARNIIGASVRDRNGKALAVIDDLLFSDTRHLRAVVIRDGAFLGLGGDNAIIGADRFDFAVAADGEMIITAEIAEGELRQMTDSLAFEPTDGVINPGNLMSVNRFLDRSIVNSNGDEIADPFDIVFGMPGHWGELIVSVGGLGAIGNRLVSIDSALITMDGGSGDLRLADNAPDLDTLPTFEYR